MSLTTGDISYGVQIGGRSGKPLLMPFAGKCTAFVTNDITPGLQIGGKSGKPLNFADNICDTDGTLKTNRVYVGIQIGGKSGKPLLLAGCKTCGETTPGYCGCTICCTLSATVQIASTANPFAWTDAIDADLTCGGSFEVTHFWRCVNDGDEVFHTFRQTWEGGTGTGTWTSGTYDYKTDVWVSDEITIEAGFLYRNDDPVVPIGTTTGQYKVFFAATEYTYHQEGHEDFKCCAYHWGVLVQYNLYSPYPTDTAWGFYYSHSASTGGTGCGVQYTQSEDTAPECPDGYTRDLDSNVFPDGDYYSSACPIVGISYTPGGSSTVTMCPVAIAEETWTRLAVDADDDAHRRKCTKLSIGDLCDDDG